MRQSASLRNENHVTPRTSGCASSHVHASVVHAALSPPAPSGAPVSLTWMGRVLMACSSATPGPKRSPNDCHYDHGWVVPQL